MATGYCMKCKAQREIKNSKQITMKNGRPATERTCPTCGRSNPEEADFCECGEYLRWEPTNVVRAVAPAAAGRSAAAHREQPLDLPDAPTELATPEDPSVTLAPADATPRRR